MTRVATQLVVALVHHDDAVMTLTLWYRTIGEAVGQPMGSADTLTPFQMTIAAGIYGARPVPTVA